RSRIGRRVIGQTGLQSKPGQERSFGRAASGCAWSNARQCEHFDGAMTMVPATLFAREMRSAARHPLTYNLRTFSAAALLAVSAVSIAEGGSDADWGARVYPHLHAALMGAIWVLVPLLTADCISRERRERTLPLLFLTPLNSWQIVQAKGLANGLRAFTLWLAVLPVLTIAFMAGGVSWQDVVLSLLVSFGSICLAMAAGLLASALTRVWMRALSLSALLS